jgi:hypothetical protein
VRRAALLGLYSQNRLESSDGWLSLATNAERLKITTLINYLFIYLLTIVYLYILAHVIVVLITLVTRSNITFHLFSAAAGTLSFKAAASEQLH